MAIQADIAYQRSREDLLPYEDGRFNALFAAFANCYPLKSDYTIFAAFVRALARELARAEYQNSYSMVATDPNFLTPPDIKRQFADLLKINKSFPSASQDDQQYKQMLVDLAPAYNLGTVTAAIKAVIKAYTGEDVAVREVSQEVGTGVVQDYDRNYIQIALPGTQTDPLTGLTSAAWLATLSRDLYTAIDLAKPAHIGLDYAIVFGSTEDMQARVRAITDVYSPAFEAEEAPDVDDIFTQAPFLDPSSPDTRLSAYGKVVGEYFEQIITASQYSNLASDDFRAEYRSRGDGNYELISDRVWDVILVDANGNPTGEISRARAILAPNLVKSWEIKGDTLEIFELD